jgi:predicted GNAT superfamily acetyltransferase
MHMAAESETGQITIRHCNGYSDCRACMDVQVAVWNYQAEDVVPHHVLLVAAKTGGQVLGAFDNQEMVGFALAFPAIRGYRFYLHSHMVAVLPQYQSRGIGRLLKIQQREDALARDIGLIEWTFDPLELRNAYFNVARLGAIIRSYIADMYGSSSSPLHARLPTDRLIAEWQLGSPRVRACIEGARAHPTKSAVSIAVPNKIAELRCTAPARALEIQARVRREFGRLFEERYAVTGFSLTEEAGTYLLERYED